MSRGNWAIVCDYDLSDAFELPSDPPPGHEVDAQRAT